MEVLLVDDQAFSIQVFAASVRKTFSGAKVHIAVDLPDALQIASGHPLDLVLLDLALPTCSGIDALQIQACLAAGARGYITKASALVALPAAMKAVMSGSRYAPEPPA
jgi:DNA-binding NarL/FixJ family response regulator